MPSHELLMGKHDSKGSQPTTVYDRLQAWSKYKPDLIYTLGSRSIIHVDAWSQFVAGSLPNHTHSVRELLFCTVGREGSYVQFLIQAESNKIYKEVSKGSSYPKIQCRYELFESKVI